MLREGGRKILTQRREGKKARGEKGIRLPHLRHGEGVMRHVLARHTVRAGGRFTLVIVGTGEDGEWTASRRGGSYSNDPTPNGGATVL